MVLPLASFTLRLRLKIEAISFPHFLPTRFKIGRHRQLARACIIHKLLMICRSHSQCNWLAAYIFCLLFRSAHFLLPFRHKHRILFVYVYVKYKIKNILFIISGCQYRSSGPVVSPFPPGRDNRVPGPNVKRTQRLASWPSWIL